MKSQTSLFKGNRPSREPGYSSHHIASGYLPDTVELIPTLEALPPRGGPVQVLVLTGRMVCTDVWLPKAPSIDIFPDPRSRHMATQEGRMNGSPRV